MIKANQANGVILLVFAFLLSVNLAFSQSNTPKYGDVSIEELEMTSSEIDSSANAVVLFDVGSAYLIYNQNKGMFECKVQRHVRIKILTREGLDWSEVSIPLYNSSSDRETISRIRAHTYNLKDGKIETERLPRRGTFTEKVNENWSKELFTMPQVTEGSIIEFTYNILSPFIYSLPHWIFQREIPVLYSEYDVRIPEYFNYQFHISGYEKVNIERSTGSSSITFSGVTRSGSRTVSQRHYSETITYQENIYTFNISNVPTLKNEPYLDNASNYQSRVDFELLSTKFPNSTIQNYTGTWEKVVEDMLKMDRFGQQLSSSSFLRDEVKDCIKEKETDEENINSIINFINERVKWNGDYSVLAQSAGARRAFRNGSGNSAEMNFLLILALREAGYNAYPIALSTRSHGIIHSWQVTMNGFNHVITGIDIDGELSLFDATSSFKALNILPTQCLNGQGRLIDKELNKWVELNPEENSRLVQMAEITLEPDGRAKGRVEQTQNNYFAQRAYNKFDSEAALENFLQSLSKQHNNAIIDSLEHETNYSSSPTVKYSYNVQWDNYANSSVDFIYLSPGEGLLMTTNSFTSNERKMPVIYDFPSDMNSIIKIKVPEGYTVDDLPDNIRISMPDGSIQFLYSITSMNNEIIVSSRVRITKTLFLPSEYQYLKDFFDMVANKNTESIVLKKVDTDMAQL